MRKRILWIATLLCAMVLALPVIAHAESTVSGELVSTETDQNKIQFGSYPQTEIVGTASQSGTSGKSWRSDNDCIENASLYESLQSATYDSNGDTVIEGTKYHRVNRSDTNNYGTNASDCFNWSDASSYRYFRYDPIEWRILSKEGNNAFLLAEDVLDDQLYNKSSTSITWEKCTMRSWLNGYDSTQNTCGEDYSNNNFIGTAFTDTEKESILTTSVVNENNSEYSTPGGNPTQDKIFLLSESEAYGNAAEAYGFVADRKTCDENKRAKSSSYAKARGVKSAIDDNYLGNCKWWLRSPGYENTDATLIGEDGYGFHGGTDVESISLGVRPALHLDLSDTENWSTYTAKKYNMTLSATEFTYDSLEKKPDVTITGLTQDTDFTVEYQNNTKVGTGTVRVKGMGTWSGTMSKTFKIGYDISNAKVLLEQSSYTYDGTAKEPKVAVTITNETLKKGEQYEVTYSNNINPGKATVTITGIGEFYGSVTADFDITAQDISGKTITLDQTSYVYSGNAYEPAVSIEGLTKGTDYTVSYSDNTAAGTATVTVTGKGNYTGTASTSFEISKRDISQMTFKLSPKNFDYDGTEKKPTITINGLTEGTDFEVTYSDNVKPGSGTAKATGIGNYRGQLVRTFTINKVDPSYEIPEGITTTCESQLSTVVLPEGFAWEYPKRSAGEAGEHKFEATFTPDNTDLYNVIYDIQIPVTVNHSYSQKYDADMHWNECACGQKSDEEAHVWGDFTIDTEPTCTQDGSKSIHCQKCDATKDVTVIPASGHQYVSKTIAAKIGVAGKTYEECSNCGDVINVKTIKALRPYSTAISKLTRSKKAFTVKWKKKTYTGYQIRYSRYSSMKSAKMVTITKNQTTSKKVKKLKAKKKYYVQVRTYKTVNGTKCYSTWSKKKSVRTK